MSKIAASVAERAVLHLRFHHRFRECRRESLPECGASSLQAIIIANFSANLNVRLFAKVCVRMRKCVALQQTKL